MKQGRLSYNPSNDRYGVLVSDLWEHNGFHCGDSLQVKIDDEWIDTSMEMDWNTGKGVWYLIGIGIKGGNLEGLTVRY